MMVDFLNTVACCYIIIKTGNFTIVLFVASLRYTMDLYGGISILMLPLP